MKQNGFILIVSLIFLVIMTMLGIAMFGGVTMDERMSGNQREKSRSLDAAQMTLNYVDNWLANSSNTVCGGTLFNGSPGNCLGAGILSAASAVASNPNPSDPTTWTSFAAFAPITGASSVMAVNAAGGLNTYSSQPKYYIQFLGFVPGSTNTGYYQVTAAAQGGNNTATTVVRSVYRVKAKSVDLGS